jgi:hypothetical protein
MSRWRASEGALLAYVLTAAAMIVLARARIGGAWAWALAHLAVGGLVVALAEIQHRRGGPWWTLLRAWDAAVYLPVCALLAGVAIGTVHPVNLSGEIRRVDAWIGWDYVAGVLHREVGEGIAWVARAMSHSGWIVLIAAALRTYSQDRAAFWRMKSAVVLAVLVALLAAIAVPTGSSGPEFVSLRVLGAVLGVCAAWSWTRARGLCVAVCVVAVLAALALGAWERPDGVAGTGALATAGIGVACWVVGTLWEQPVAVPVEAPLVIADAPSMPDAGGWGEAAPAQEPPASRESAGAGAAVGSGPESGGQDRDAVPSAPRPSSPHADETAFPSGFSDAPKGASFAPQVRGQDRDAVPTSSQTPLRPDEPSCFESSGASTAASPVPCGRGQEERGVPRAPVPPPQGSEPPPAEKQPPPRRREPRAGLV